MVTAGLVLDRFKLEASRFNGREPDQHRYNIETGPLDSTAVRLSWNPTDTLSLQGSWAYLKEPEQLEPGVNQRRLSASSLYHRKLDGDRWVAATIAWGRRSQEGRDFDAFALEGGYGWKNWTFFSRAELIENNELVAIEEGGEGDPGHESKAFTVGKVSLGLVRDFRLATNLTFGVGGLYSLNFVPKDLRQEYGTRNPQGAMGFVRLKIQ